MNNKSSNRYGLVRFFRQQIHSKDSTDNMFELLKPEDEWKRTESIIEDILRWADDGGQMLDIGSPVYRVKLGYGSGTGKRMMDVRGNGS